RHFKVNASLGEGQVYPLDKFHVVQQGVESYEIGKGNLMTTSACTGNCYQISFDILGQEMTFAVDHDIRKVDGRDVTLLAIVRLLERLNRMFLVKVVQHLRKFGKVDSSLVALTKVKPHKVRFEVDRDLAMKSCKLDNVLKFVKGDEA